VVTARPGFFVNGTVPVGRGAARTRLTPDRGQRSRRRQRRCGRTLGARSARVDR
jgi:hypothetical protein